MKVICFLFVFLLGIRTSEAQHVISGQILDSQTGKGISFATIRAIDYLNLGAISDNDGNFKIQLTEYIDSLYVHVSASAYHYQNIYLQSTKDAQLIKLEERIFELGEVEVVPLKEGEINWNEHSDGLKLYGSIDKNEGFLPMMMKLNSSGEFHGNAFRLKKMIKLNDISFHFFKGTDFPDKLYMRVFSTDDKPEFSKNMSLNGLNELTSKTIVLDNLKDGLNIIDVSGENMLAVPGYLIIAFTADINDIPQKKLALYQEKSGGKDILRFSLSPSHFTIFPPFLPKYLIGFRYAEVEEKKARFRWLRSIFRA
ncbi:carboxypeptidase-like regulatory domain-containing protein [Mongoliitalea lutea]|uniref:CarboxypepD_reg-like domain-containing protein n=1 Tax=Mongoliitalea lutea TaxID=849756 RepID=A0A8J3G4W8_9BACT|nr:carboxypeptidase-like regulatory domain-containing protein [Mongoliitalea lutea]GHB34180.1 hypothetical protein GCM10008106_14280 [Mongoliitalea lutea]